MGHVCLLLKPNTSAPYGGAATATGDSADADHGATGVAGGNTITIGPLETISSLKVGDNNTTSDWIVVASQLFRILSIAGQVMTIEGVIGTSFTNVVWNTYASVPAHIRWTDPSTITYLRMEFNSSQPSWAPAVDVKRYANRGSTIINLKKLSGTRVFKSAFLGSLLDSETEYYTKAGQIQRALNYMVTEWPSVTTKYCNLYWYNGYARNTHRDVWVSASTWRMERAVMGTGKIEFNEDFMNNLILDTLALELV